MSCNLSQIQRKANLLFQNKQYTQAAVFYEQAISQNPKDLSNYWYLGLSLLFQGQEVEAQIAWMTPILEASEKQQEAWTEDLLQVLEKEVQYQEDNKYWQWAWLLRQHIQEIAPNHIENLFQLVRLSIATGNFEVPNQNLEQITKHLQNIELQLEQNLLWNCLQEVLETAKPDDSVLQFIAVCVHQLPITQELVNLLVSYAQEWRSFNQINAARLSEICVEIDPNNIDVLKKATSFLQEAGRYSDSILLTERLLDISENIGNHLVALHLQIRGCLCTGDRWEEALEAHSKNQKLLEKIILQPNLVTVRELKPMITSGFFAPYFYDSPQEYRPLRNRYAQICQEKIQNESNIRKYPQYKNNIKNRNGAKLKIGYISNFFYKHSIGWLVRWTLLHHNRDRVEVHAYSTGNNKNVNDPVQKRISQICQPYFHEVKENIASKIAEDEINVLIDLDSLTSNNGAILALKPAPVQVTWLGFDASGFPAVDYFLADPYVLPESASQYYTETIWRLPQNYVAVDGFEIGVPTLRRDRLGIPNDAIVYFSSQSGQKRNPDNVKAQMQILKEVPNSYFLVKGLLSEPESVQKFFEEMAESEGISRDRVRVLPNVPLEATHRGNLEIADVILDTYPYNGATTTLEALWVGIPIVTQVGTQFAARNSYTMLMNVGVTEGIAWSREEYIEWGIRLGKDEKLRQKVTWQLRMAKQKAAPLWNTEQFVNDLEDAYEQMWQRFVDGA
jgi:predicted O-linked N-acetylglucosamine transferase (SPINDLY family)